MLGCHLAAGREVRSDCCYAARDQLLMTLAVCLGLHLALTELRLATTAFFRAYPNAKVSTLDGFGDEEMEQVIFFLMFPKGKRCLIQAS
jgi:hypothetical protein